MRDNSYRLSRPLGLGAVQFPSALYCPGESERPIDPQMKLVRVNSGAYPRCDLAVTTAILQAAGPGPRRLALRVAALPESWKEYFRQQLERIPALD